MSSTAEPSSSSSELPPPIDPSFGLKLRAPTDKEQVVLKRITEQRERLLEQSAMRVQQRALLRARQGLPPNASAAVRALEFAKQHPLALVAVAGAAMVAGPKRLIHWAGVALPLLLRLRG